MVLLWGGFGPLLSFVLLAAGCVEERASCPSGTTLDAANRREKRGQVDQQRGPEDGGVLNTCLALAQGCVAAVDVDKGNRLLDGMVNELKGRMDGEQSPRRIVETINHYLYDERRSGTAGSPVLPQGRQSNRTGPAS